MAAESEKNALYQLVETFTDVSAQAKELEKVINNFGEITEEFRETLLYIDEKMSVSTLASLSEEALVRLKEVKEFNDFKVIGSLESVVAKKLEEQTKVLQKESSSSAADANALARMERKLNEMANTINSIVLNPKKEEENSQEELIALLTKIEVQTRQHQNIKNGVPEQSDELAELKQMVNDLTNRLNKLEDYYEAKILTLEAEVIFLKEGQN